MEIINKNNQKTCKKDDDLRRVIKDNEFYYNF